MKGIFNLGIKFTLPRHLKLNWSVQKLSKEEMLAQYIRQVFDGI